MDRIIFLYRQRTKIHSILFPIFVGPHQIINASVALLCLDHLQKFNVPHEARIRGLQNAEWPARLERIKSSPYAEILPPDAELWF